MKVKQCIREDGREVIIGGETYYFHNRIGESQALKASFNQLAADTFSGLSFDDIGGYYEPHVLVKNGEVCANVSVNQIPFAYDGREIFCIQLGTVMTKTKYRNRGLSRWLIEYILAQWEGRCDILYLFANDSVLEFYPKFGFREQKQFRCYCCGVRNEHNRIQKLQMDTKEHRELAKEKYAQGNPFSRLCMRENDILFSFYAMRMMKDCVYYSQTYDVLILAKEDKGCLWCYDIFGDTDGRLEDIIGEITNGENQKVYLGFTPKDPEGFVMEEHVEEDTTFFVHEASEKIFEKNRLMFPAISVA